MIHPFDERFAELLVGYCTRVEPGDRVALHLDTPAEPLARALFRRVLATDAEPILHLSYPEQLLDLIEGAGERYFDSAPTLDRSEIETVGAWIRVRAPSNLRTLQGVDKERHSRYQRRLAPVTRHRIEKVRWVSSLYPTPAAAQEAGMSLDDYRAFVSRALFLDDDDPAARWRELGARQQVLVDRLDQADEVHLLGNGTDLRLRVGGRLWINSDGRRNMPSGEIYTGPIETSAEGTVRFDIPSDVNGARVEGVQLRFERGEVVAAEADQGDGLLQAQLATDAGARRLGEIGIGTNFSIDRPTGSTLYDEKIGGTFHLALGRSYATTGGVNKSTIHWDLISDIRQEGEIRLDGEPFLVNGAFVDA
jgi:aminopeptidase